jgi:hypothetical protein
MVDSNGIWGIYAMAVEIWVLNSLSIETACSLKHVRLDDVDLICASAAK